MSVPDRYALYRNGRKQGDFQKIQDALEYWWAFGYGTAKLVDKKFTIEHNGREEWPTVATIDGGNVSYESARARRTIWQYHHELENIRAAVDAETAWLNVEIYEQALAQAERADRNVLAVLYEYALAMYEWFMYGEDENEHSEALQESTDQRPWDSSTSVAE